MFSKKALPIAGLAMILLIAAACSPAPRPGTFYDGQNNVINQQQRSNWYISNQKSDSYGNRLGPRPALDQAGRGQNKIGFIHYTKASDAQTNNRSMKGPEMYIDRRALANYIGSLATAYPQITDAMVLVTDDYVFIGVNDTAGDGLDEKTANEMRRAALSVTPRYYKVKVTSDDDLRQRMRAIGNKLSWNNGDLVDVEHEMNQMIREIGDGSPPRSTP